jgi:hypothetical protein
LVLQAGVAREFLPDKFISLFSPPILGSKKAILRRDLVMSHQVMDQLNSAASTIMCAHTAVGEHMAAHLFS